MVSSALPHAYPFRFIDTVLENAGAAAEATLGSPSPWQGRARVRITGNTPATMGREWASPVLLAEAIAQAALLLEQGDPEAGRRGFLAGIESFQVQRAPSPGESLSITVRLCARFGAIAKFEGEIHAEDGIIARGAILVKRGEGM